MFVKYNTVTDVNKKKIVIVSANNYGNAGDDVGAYIYQRAVEKKYPQFQVVVTQPPFDEKTVESCSMLVLAGGGIIYDAVPENVANYMIYLDWAKQNEAVALGLGLGVQGIVSKEGRESFRASLNSTKHITVRSQKDKEELEKIDVTSTVTEDIGLLADEFFLSKKNLHRAVDKIRKLFSKKRIGLIIFDLSYTKNFPQLYSKATISNSQRFMNNLNSYIDELKNKYEVTIIVQSKDDLDLSEELAEKHGLKKFVYTDITDMPSLLKTINRQDLIISSRFHGTLFACSLGVSNYIVGLPENKQEKMVGSQLISMGERLKLLSDYEAIEQIYSGREKFNFELNETQKKEIDREKSIARKNIDLLLSEVDQL